MQAVTILTDAAVKRIKQKMRETAGEVAVVEAWERHHAARKKASEILWARFHEALDEIREACPELDDATVQTIGNSFRGWPDE
jgi:hypothetical protein